jgi:GDPmannose 4,6-dehydratase
MHRRVALITGISGQDGFYLARHLLQQGYVVHGLRRRSSAPPPDRLLRLAANGRHANSLFLHFGDMTDPQSLIRVIKEAAPVEIYNLAAQSHVHVSFDKPAYTASVNALGALNLLEALRLLGLKDQVRFYQASTSEMYGLVRESPQTEVTPFHPRSPYAIAKVFAHHTTVNYREAYGFHASNGICFNHEGPERGETFVSRKITRAVAARKLGDKSVLCLGNLDAKRDWGHVQDYVEGMQLMLQQEHGDDYVLATGENRSVRQFAEIAYREIGHELQWEGEGLRENGRDKKTGALLIAVDPKHFRPADVNALVGDSSKARARLGWKAKIPFEAMVREMVSSDVQRLASPKDSLEI